MFNHEQIKKFTDVEMLIYNYVIQNSQNIRYMTIRELADAVHVSTSAIMRFCKKLDCEGYAEFKVQFKLYLEDKKEKQPLNDISEVMNYFETIDNIEFDWNENALKSAENYQDIMDMSHAAIYDQLVSEYGEQFTPEEAQYAIDNLK